jgi:hypothetical protein
MKFFAPTVALCAFLSASAIAADLHPIIEVQNGYLVGATKERKWIKAEETTKALPDETTYKFMD